MSENKWIYSIKVYIDFLIKANSCFIQLLGSDGKEKFNIREEKYLEIFDYISKLIPISTDINTKSVKVKLRDKKESGIFELYNDGLEFIEEDYNKLIEKYKVVLFDIKMIRNKTEHSPHCILSLGGTSKLGYSNIWYNYKKNGIKIDEIENKNVESYKCDTEMLKKILIDLNNIFSKVQSKIVELYDKLDFKDGRVYIKTCIETNFSYYNNLYNSEKLYEISKIISNI